MAPYCPAPTGRRATTLGFIALLHVIALGALAAAGGPRVAVQRLASIEVRFVAPSTRPAEPLPTPLAQPALRRPDIAPPVLPPIEIAVAAPAEAPPAITLPRAAEPPRSIAVAVLPQAANPEASTLEPPRFDLAYLRNPAPPYPPLSRRLKEEGRVMLRVRVGAAGEVEAIELAASSGHARLDQAALAAVRQWHFTPARAGEQKVAGWAMVPVVFQLNG